MESLVIGGKRYISSKRAAEIMGYTQDYIGQLARAGKILAERVSGVWYVNEDELSGQSASNPNDEKTNEINTQEEQSDDKKDKSKITLEGVDYISSKRAAQVMGYTQDYIGQLCRRGKIESRQIGRGWYIPESVVYKGIEESVEKKVNRVVSKEQKIEQREALGDIVAFNDNVAEKSVKLEKSRVIKEESEKETKEDKYYYPSFLSTSYSIDDTPLVPEPKRSREPVLHKIVEKEERVRENNVAIRRIPTKAAHTVRKQVNTQVPSKVQRITKDILKPEVRGLSSRLPMSLVKMASVGVVVLLFVSIVTIVPSTSVFSSKIDTLKASVVDSTSKTSLIETIVIILGSLFEDTIEYKAK